MNDQQRYLAGLDFYIEERRGVPVLVYKRGGYRPATDIEWALWQEYFPESEKGEVEDDV